MHAENVRKSLPANGYARMQLPKLAYARGREGDIRDINLSPRCSTETARYGTQDGIWEYGVGSRALLSGQDEHVSAGGRVKKEPCLL